MSTHSQDALPPLSAALQQHGLWANKGLGQHFLLQESWTTRIAQLAGNLEGVQVIEVGPGPGGLTRSLLASTGAAHVTAVEMDRRFTPLLEPLGEHHPGRFTLHFGDALKTDMLAITPAPRQVIANLPYNVGTELLVQWLLAIAKDGPEAFTQLVLMFQQEVAERIRASVGGNHYGRLAVLSQWLCKTRCGLHVPAGAFSPPPKVESKVVVLTPYALEDRLPCDAQALQQVTAAAFGQRRKMLRGALKTLTDDAEALLNEAGIEPTARAETVDIAGFVRLANAWKARCAA
jgi:16S rRNA (adenine1518-N6/adenine1519-N6)-dimethyltransferase